MYKSTLLPSLLVFLVALSGTAQADPDCPTLAFDGELVDHIDPATGALTRTYTESGLTFEAPGQIGLKVLDNRLRVMADTLVYRELQGALFTPVSFDCELPAAQGGTGGDGGGETHPQNVVFVSSKGGVFDMASCEGLVEFPADETWTQIAWFDIETEHQYASMWIGDFAACYGPADEDGDGVPDDMDICPATVGEGPGKELKDNRWMEIDGDLDFEEGAKEAFDMSDTAGCTCTQILYEKHWDEKMGELKGGARKELEEGCKEGTLKWWIKRLKYFEGAPAADPWADSDGDSVPDALDACPGSQREWPTKALKDKHWMQTDADPEFEEGAKHYFNMMQTGGCNCTQIVYEQYWDAKKGTLKGKGEKQLKEGCEHKILEWWIDNVVQQPVNPAPFDDSDDGEVEESDDD